MLNVVNFGGGSYVLYAEVQGDQIEVDPEPYGDNFARPARLLPLEAKALVAAIDLIGEHLPEGSLASARQKIVDALGQDPADEGLQITTAKGDDSEVAGSCPARSPAGAAAAGVLQGERGRVHDAARSSPTSSPMGRRAGTCTPTTSRRTPPLLPARPHPQATVLDEEFEPREGIEPDVQGWLRHRRGASVDHGPDLGLPERARWAREDRRVVEELADGAVIVERTYASHDWLAREILKEAGDAVVLGPGRRPRGGARGRRGARRRRQALAAAAPAPPGRIAGTASSRTTSASLPRRSAGTRPDVHPLAAIDDDAGGGPRGPSSSSQVSVQASSLVVGRGAATRTSPPVQSSIRAAPSMPTWS